MIAADAMDQALVDLWNGVVRPRDTVWHFGDFAMGREVTADRCWRIFAAPNVEKHLVLGNHDFENADMLGLV